MNIGLQVRLCRTLTRETGSARASETRLQPLRRLCVLAISSANSFLAWISYLRDEDLAKFAADEWLIFGHNSGHKLAVIGRVVLDELKALLDFMAACFVQPDLTLSNQSQSMPHATANSHEIICTLGNCSKHILAASGSAYLRLKMSLVTRDCDAYGAVTYTFHSLVKLELPSAW